MVLNILIGLFKLWEEKKIQGAIFKKMFIKLDLYFWAVIIFHSLTLPYLSVKIDLSRKLQVVFFLVEDHDPGHWFAVGFLQ